MKTIPLINGKETMVDDDDYEWARHFSWYVTNGGYAYFTCGAKCVYLHRMIMEPCDPFYVDHKNHDPLDNRKKNLRLVTPQENMFNRKKRRTKTYTEFKGVYYRSENKYRKWEVIFSHKDRPYTRRAFLTEKEAARAYDKEIVKHQGEYAFLNFPKH